MTQMELSGHPCPNCGYGGPHLVLSRTCRATSTGMSTAAGVPILAGIRPVIVAAECGACHSEFKASE